MKSLLQEGSSVVKAIEAAWVKVGKPEEFSVKVLKNEEQRFLGITWKNSVVISISYDYGNQEKKISSGKVAPRQDTPKKIQHEDILEKVMRDTEKLHAETDCFAGGFDLKKNQKPRREEVKKVVEKKAKKQLEKKSESTENAQVSDPSFLTQREKTVKSDSKKHDVVASVEQDIKEHWTPEMINAVLQFLQNLLEIMELNVSVIHKTNGLQLHILFDRVLSENKDLEYKIYTSLAFLMLQMVKRESKKKCKGYRVIFGLQQAENQ